MKKVIVKFIGVKKYLVTDNADPQKIKDMFRKDLELLPGKRKLLLEWLGKYFFIYFSSWLHSGQT